MNTETPTNNQPSVVKREHVITFFLWVLTIDFLFYSQNWGLNALLLNLVTIPLFGLIDKKNFTSGKWALAAFIWLLTGIGMFINASPLAVTGYFLSFFFFAAVSHNSKLSIPLGITQSIHAAIVGFNDFFIVAANGIVKPRKNGNKLFINSLMIIIPLILVLVFLKLYQAADPTFYEYTKFINLDWISWGFLLTLLFLIFFLYGFLRFHTSASIDQLEESKTNKTPIDYTDQVQRFFGIQNESKIARNILISLNLMLLVYIIIDFQFIFVGMHDPARTSTLSEIVHNGVDAQMASIVLVILCVTLFTRGQLNFQKSRLMQTLILIWLALNVIMILNSGIKNLEYVNTWGFTYKRAGVFVYLFLAFLGLIITAIKVIYKRSVWYLLRTSSLVFALTLCTLLTFNWSRTIAWYNTSYVAAEKLDYNYLHELGPQAYPFILKHHQAHGTAPDWLLLHIMEDIPTQLQLLEREKENTSWLSWVWSDRQLEKELKSFTFNTH